MSKTLTIITTATVIMYFSLLPAYAYSTLAENFLRECRTTDAAFPPENWSVDDLRIAALEVLDDIELNGGDTWPVYFCLITLGYVQYPDDIERILAYEDDRPRTVLRALCGYPDPTAINTLLAWAATDTSERELAYIGLKEINYDLLDEPDEWREIVVNELNRIREFEEIPRLIEMLDETIINIQNNSLE